MRILRYDQPNFRESLKHLQRHAAPSAKVEETVRDIITKVRKQGDKAVLQFAAKFDRAKLKPEQMLVTEAEYRHARSVVPANVKKAIATAQRNVRDFAKRSMRKNWQAKNAQGVLVGERFDPFERVGIYVPAGTAPLASTVLMTVPLAATAGVPQIVVTTPVGESGEINPAVLYALDVTGATEVYKIGGAQAIAAMACGTETIRPVVKIFGPGNPWVVEAKRQVFGQVAVDLLPGPSEIFVIADDTARPSWIAADLLAQAEHGHGSSIVFATDSAKLLGWVEEEVYRQAHQLNRKAQLTEVLNKSAALILVKSLGDAVEIANDFAPEHLSLVAKDEARLAARIRTSGAIFLGGMSPVVGGDFLAGPSHELPTGGAGKSFAGLTVDQFQRRTSIVRFDEKSLKKSLPTIQTFSDIEGLDAHGSSAAIRFT